MDEQNSGKKEKMLTGKMSIKTKLLLLAILPALLVTVILLLIAHKSMNEGMVSESVDSMKYLVRSVEAGMAHVSDGEYSLNADGDLMKGDYNITKDEELIDSFTEGSDCDITLCYKNVRKATSFIDEKTKKRIVGTEVAEEVWQEVQKGNIYKNDNLELNGKPYVAVYRPLKDSNGSVIGIVFAGMPKVSFIDVEKGIDRSRDNTEMIRGNADSCDNARAQINDVISNLSAISEENAASAEETTASMQELNATINLLSDTAKDLKKVSDDITEVMTIFKL